MSLDPNLPNALPGPLRLATQQQAKTAGYQAQPTTAYTATDGTAFAVSASPSIPNLQPGRLPLLLKAMFD